MNVARRPDEKCSASRLTVVHSAWVVTAQKPGTVRLLVPPDRRVAAQEGEPIVGHAVDEVPRVGEVDVGELDAAPLDVGLGHRTTLPLDRTVCPTQWILCPVSIPSTSAGVEARIVAVAPCPGGR